jgi:polyferredoxin
MASMMSDHQDSDHFSYERSWEEIEVMLSKAETMRNSWEMKFIKAKSQGNKKECIKCLRNMKALEGVVKTLRWTLGDINIPHPLD